MMKSIYSAIVLLLLVRPAGAMTPEERRQYGERLLKILPEVPSFREWLAKTGEIPPDFDSFPKVNGLPDPLRFLDGRAVRNQQDWQTRRA